MKHTKNFLLFFLLILVGCKSEELIQPPEDSFGEYSSSVFIEPGQADGGVDIIASGGYLFLKLNRNFTFTGTLNIPKGVQSNYGSGTFKGNYALSGNLIEFQNASFLIDKIIWKQKDQLLVSLEVPRRGQPFKIILSKLDF